MPAPTVTALSPASGPAGTLVTLTGTGFTEDTSAVMFGAVSAGTRFSVVSGTQMTAYAPAGTGTVSVKATTPGGVGTVGSNWTYDPYVGPPAGGGGVAPTVTSVVPSSAVDNDGGDAVVINGTGFTAATAVLFGDALAQFTVISDTALAVTTPGGSGVVDVTVVTAYGISANTAADNFTYPVGLIPTITSFDPASTGEMALVTITGTNFWTAAGIVVVTGVTFTGAGGVEIPAVFRAESATTLIACVPDGALTGPITVYSEAGSATSASFTCWGNIYDVMDAYAYAADAAADDAEAAAAVADGKAVAARDAADAAASDAAAAAVAAALADDKAVAAQATADGAVVTYYQADAPTGLNDTTDLGNLWFDTDTDQAYRWAGSGNGGWKLINDNAIAVALSAAQSAQATADGKITAFYQTTAPTTLMEAGDLWFDTDDKNKPYYYDVDTDDIIPTMTSAAAPSGMVRSSGDFSETYAAWHAFDDMGTDLAHSWVAPSGVGTGWFSYQFPTARTITRYAITSMGNVDPCAPKTWAFMGSNDNAAWTTLDTQTNITDWAALPNERKVFDIANAVAYAYHSLDITDGNNGGALSVGELEMMESGWSAVRDGTIADAAAAANAADAAADAAQAAADAADAKADAARAAADAAAAAAAVADDKAVAAQASANGKNRVFYNSGVPGATANLAGDVWFRYGSGPTANQVIAQYVGLGGTSWQSVTMSNQVIASLDVAKLTAGTINVAIALTAATITGGVFRTAESSSRVVVSPAAVGGVAHAVSFFSGASFVGQIVGVAEGLAVNAPGLQVIVGGHMRALGNLTVQGSVKPSTDWVSAGSEDGIWIQDRYTTSKRWKLVFNSNTKGLSVSDGTSTYNVTLA